jgi:hypothetical protein
MVVVVTVVRDGVDSLDSEVDSNTKTSKADRVQPTSPRHDINIVKRQYEIRQYEIRQYEIFSMWY